ncbi:MULTISPECIES: DUF2207 domain-containing protein [Bacillus]|nr:MULTISPECIES: DUF2207 domain-containing protein [Bacillus]QHZ48705.1 DUF2207 domain-containing protein [Bacillus sp. NSP9.1]
MKHSFFFFMLFAFFLLAGFSSIADQSFSIDRVDIQANVKENGDLDVEEVYTYRFKGSFNGASRSFSKDETGRIKGFKAYLLAKTGEARPLKTTQEDGTYFAHTAVKDEAKKVLFHYAVEDAAKKFEDTSVLRHSFFQKTNTVMHHVNIRVRLPDSVQPADIHAFLREKGDGEITGISYHTVIYHSGMIPAGTSSELRIYFPQNALPKAVRHPSYQTVDDLLAEEKNEAERYAKRGGRLENADRTASVFSGIIGLMIVAVLILSLVKKRRQKLLPLEKLEAFDPVLVAYLYRKGSLTERDLLAGLLSLYQRGLVTMKKVRAEERFLRDRKAPDETYQFEFSDDLMSLTKPDRLFIEKLFEQKENGVYLFRLDSLSGPTEEEIEEKEGLEKYERKRIILQNVVQKWTENIRQDAVYKELFQENRWLRMLSLTLLFFQTGFLLYIMAADVVPQAGFMIVCMIFGFALSAGIVLAKYKLYSIMFFLGLFIASLFTDSISTILFYGISLALSIVLIALIPSIKESRSAFIYRRSVLSWRNQLRQGAGLSERSLSENEKIFVYAIVLEIEDESMAFVKGSKNGLDQAFPILGMAACGDFHYPFLSWQQTLAVHGHTAAHHAGGSGSDGGSGPGAF